jgi:hypothetical protein
MKKYLFLVLASIALLASCQNNMTNSTTAFPRRTVGTYGLTLPVNDSSITLDSTQFLLFRWLTAAIELTGTVRHTVVIDRDTDFTNGSVLRVETFNDSLRVPYRELRSLNLARNDTSFIYGVIATNNNETLRSANLYRFYLNLK